MVQVCGCCPQASGIGAVSVGLLLLAAGGSCTAGGFWLSGAGLGRVSTFAVLVGCEGKRR
jgi:hypothetical protein